MYDSTKDTISHIMTVRKYLTEIVDALHNRCFSHDRTKLYNPEKPIFDNVTPKLKELTYGSDEYKIQLKEMDVALDHHYKHNKHHPEHYENGIRDMDLVDLVEMICDWKAASERHTDGDIMKSIEINQKRFGYSDDLKSILINTVKRRMEPIQYMDISDTSGSVLKNSFKDYK